MRILNILRLRLRSLVHRDTVERELDEEFRYHLEREIDIGVRSGMTGEEARYSALRSVSDLQQTKEQCRDLRGLSLLENAVQDLRYAFRQLRKSPAFACAAVLVLTSGVSAAVTVLAFVDAALIQPLPYPDQARLLGVYEASPSYRRSIVSYQDFSDWRRLNRVFQSLDAYAMNGNFTLTAGASAEQVPGTRVSSGFFRTLGVVPVLGRDFLPAEDASGAPRTVLLSYSAWQERFGGKSDVLGRILNLNGVPSTVIGVLPRDFHFALYGGAEFWGNLRATDSCEQARGCRNLATIARLKDGVSIDKAAAQMRGIVLQLRLQYPADNGDTVDANLVPLRELIIGDVRPVLLVLLTGAGLLLTIACVNVSALLLARSDQRRREFGVRSALGASSFRLRRQFAAEGFLLAFLGGLLGLLCAHWGIRLLASLVSPNQMEGMPFLYHLQLNSLTTGMAGAVSLVSGVLFSMIPAARTVTVRSVTGTTWGRLGARLVVTEVAIALVLMASAGLLAKSLYLLLHVDVGFTADHLGQVGTSWRPGDFKTDRDQILLARRMESRILAIPGVQSVGLTPAPPIDSDWLTGSFHFTGQPNHGETNDVYQRQVSCGYFPTLQARLVRGAQFP